MPMHLVKVSFKKDSTASKDCHESDGCVSHPNLAACSPMSPRKLELNSNAKLVFSRSKTKAIANVSFVNRSSGRVFAQVLYIPTRPQNTRACTL